MVLSLRTVRFRVFEISRFNPRGVLDFLWVFGCVRFPPRFFRAHKTYQVAAPQSRVSKSGHTATHSPAQINKLTFRTVLYKCTFSITRVHQASRHVLAHNSRSRAADAHMHIRRCAAEKRAKRTPFLRVRFTYVCPVCYRFILSMAPPALQGSCRRGRSREAQVERLERCRQPAAGSAAHRTR